MYDRDHETAIVRSRTALGASSAISVSFLRKEFGANNFSGGNAPSREWTNQALIALPVRTGRKDLFSGQLSDQSEVANGQADELLPREVPVERARDAVDRIAFRHRLRARTIGGTGSC
jgi:hypothetical protein